MRQAKKFTPILGVALVGMGMLVGVNCAVGIANAASESTSSGTTLKQDVSIKWRNMQVTVINEVDNSVTIASPLIPRGKSTTYYRMYGLGATREHMARADELWARRIPITTVPGELTFWEKLLYFKEDYVEGQKEVTFKSSELSANLQDNTSYVLYAFGQNFGTVKVDYDRCVTAEAYKEKKATMGEGDVLECRLETNEETEEEWYQPYYNGERLEFTAADEANWALGWQGAATDDIGGDAGGDADSDAGDADGDTGDGSESGGGPDVASEGDGASDGTGVQTVWRGYAGVGEVAGQTSGQATQAKVVAQVAALESDSQSEGTTDGGDGDSTSNGDGSEQQEVEVPLLGGGEDCTEPWQFPWWIVALIGGLVAGGAGGYYLSKRREGTAE